MSYLPNTLNSFWLWKEVSAKLGVSNPAYKYWKNTLNMKLNNKYVFIQKETLNKKSLLGLHCLKLRGELKILLQVTRFRRQSNTLQP